LGATAAPLDRRGRRQRRTAPEPPALGHVSRNDARSPDRARAGSRLGARLPPRRGSRRPAARTGRQAPARMSVIAIFGPTASGKSAVAEALAERIPSELVSTDSMQVY